MPKKTLASYLNAVLAVIITACVLVAWILAPKDGARDYLFFLLGMALLWAWYAVQDLKDQGRPEDGAREELSEEQKLATQRHEERLASEEPVLTYGLIACILLIFIIQTVFGDHRGVYAAGLVRSATRNGEWWRLLTSAYLHGGGGHIFANVGALWFLGRTFEACSPPAHLPLVYLLSALGGNLASLFFLQDGLSVGASGAILGLAGYIFTVARRRAGEVPPWLKDAILYLFASTAYLGFFGYSFIDNAAHAGGAVTGALVGMVVIPRPGEPLTDKRDRVSKRLGWIAAIVLLSVAFMAGLKVIRGGLGG